MQDNVLPLTATLCKYKGEISIKQLLLFIENPTVYKTELADFVYNRLYEKYIEPFYVLEEIKKDTNYLSNILHTIETTTLGAASAEDGKIRTGFAIMANMCLLIETLQSFRYGLRSSKDINLQVFNSFFSEPNTISVFNKLKCNELEDRKEGFYSCVRCGILHQGETTKGWMIHPKFEKALNPKERTINAQKFLSMMRAVLANYKYELIHADLSSQLWNNYLLKLHTLIQNCELPTEIVKLRNWNKK